MKKIIFWMTALVIALMMAMEAKAQTNQATQTIRGQVCDVASREPIMESQCNDYVRVNLGRLNQRC